MNPDNLLSDTIGRVDWPAALLVAVPVALVLAVVFALWSERPDRRVTLIATVIGLTWMAQGMWQTATTVYRVPALFAGVLFALFETFMLGNMLRANRFRSDLARRARPVRFVWSLAGTAGAVVSLAEGWRQAPLRFVVPLLVAWNWYLDLTADDDPARQQRTSWRWTPRRLRLAIGALEPGERDMETIDAARHVAKLRDLAFAVDTGAPWLTDVLRRRTRLAKLELAATDDMIRAARADLARRGAVLEKLPPYLAHEPARRSSLETPSRKLIVPREGTQGVHVRDGQVLRGADLKADAVTLMRASIAAQPPRGMTTAELAAHYEPPLKQRTADTFAAEARRVNGHAVMGGN